MIKIAARVFDIYDDANLVVARELGSSLGGLKVAERDEVEGLPDRHFGLVMKTAGNVVRRRFPLHDLDSAKLSEAYFQRIRAQLPTKVAELTQAKILAALALHSGEADEKLLPHYEKIATLTNYVDLTALAPEKAPVKHAEKAWGLTIGGQDHFPLHDATLVKTAMARWGETIQDLAPEERMVYGRNIVKRAEALGVDVPRGHGALNYAADEINLGALKIALDERKRIIKAAEGNTTIIDQLALAAGCPLEQGPLETGDSFALRERKLAAAPNLGLRDVIAHLQNIDKMAGIGNKDYLRGLPDPFASCLKVAAGVEETMVDGVDLSKIDRSILDAHFDEDFITEFEADPVAIYQSLPEPTKQLLRSLAESGMGSENAGAVPTQTKSVGPGGDPTMRTAPQYANSGGY